MTVQKVLFCVPIYYGLVTCWVFQLVIDLAYGTWLISWLTGDHKDDIDIMKTLVGTSVAMAIWELYGAFIALVGLYGTLRRAQFMKRFMGVQVFVWVCHLGICIWNLVVYCQFLKDKRVLECREDAAEGDEDSEDDFCSHVFKFRRVPLGFVLLSFFLEAFIQTIAIYFLFHYQRMVNSSESPAEVSPETIPLTQTDTLNSTPPPMSRRKLLPIEPSLMEAGQLLPLNSAAHTRAVS